MITQFATVVQLKKIPLIPWAFLALSCLLGLSLYWSGLENIVQRWQGQAEYSHGFLIPLITLYLLWERRSTLVYSSGSFNWWSIPLCCLAMAMLVVGELSALFLIIHYSFLLFLLALSVAYLGTQAKQTFVPIAILAFAIPIPYFIEVILTSEMQLLSSSVGVAFIRAFGIPVLLSGNIIDFGGFQLHVVEACSGMRYLFPFACIGFLTAYFYRASFTKKTIVFLSTFPITLLMNSFRIAVTGLLVENYGSVAAEGFIHDFEGWVVFILCLSVLVVEVILIERFTTRMSLSEAFKPKEYEPREAKEASDKVSSVNLWLALSFLFLPISTQAFLLVENRGTQEQQYFSSLPAFPLAMGEWQGTRVPLSATVIDSLQFDNYTNIDFFRSGDFQQRINFYVAFYANQRKGQSPHSPKVCIPGDGWEISSFKRTHLNTNSLSASRMPINRVEIQRGEQRQLVYYWFVERGEVVANEYKKKWLLFRDALLSNRSDGALVRVVVSVNSAQEIAAADQTLQAFIQNVQPTLMRYLPTRENN